MMWYICLFLSMLSMAGAIALAIAGGKRGGSRILTPFRAMLVGVFVALVIGMLPLNADALVGQSWYGVKVLVFSILKTIQAFTLNEGPDLLLEITDSVTSISRVYSAYMTCLLFLAPMLLFGFIITLFRNALSQLRYVVHLGGGEYIFSELNERSLALAESIRSRNRHALIAFMSTDTEDELQSSRIAPARAMGALLMTEDITDPGFARRGRHVSRSFFAISEDPEKNVVTGLKLIEKYHRTPDTGLYVFAPGTAGELLLAGADRGDMKVRRIDDVRALVYQFLYARGTELFTTAVSKGEGDRQITAVILGLGGYGTQMLKALTWYCQMDGYRVEIHAFDSDEAALDRFEARCPELMNEKYNGTFPEGDGQYCIRIHSGIDVDTATFAKHISEIPDISFVFVSLGSDEANIRQAANMRMLCERAGSKARIAAVVFDDEVGDALADAKNYRGQPYGIEPIGSRKKMYSEELLLGTQLEQLALQRHMKWGAEEEFWRYEYNYRSSMASALHLQARIACKIPGAEKREADLTEEERRQLEMLEHRRWNTYMRSEGYVYSGSTEKESRNDLAKIHHDLVNYRTLSEEEKRKDSRVGTV